MITIKLSKKEVEYIMKYIRNGENRELYSKFWRLMFTKGEKFNGLS